MNIFRQLRLGSALTALTNYVEEIELSRAVSPIGAGGGIDSLPEPRRTRVIQEFERKKTVLSDYPRHAITRELLKNIKVSIQLERPLRLKAQSRLLDMLIDDGVALKLQDFEKSYA